MRVYISRDGCGIPESELSVSQIKSALSAEEWARLLSEHDGEHMRNALAAAVEEDPSKVPSPHSLAALALHGQTFGFSHDMVHALRSALFYNSGGGPCPVCGGDGWKMSAPPICIGCGFLPMPKGQYRKLAVAAIENVESLLPPRET